MIKIDLNNNQVIIEDERGSATYQIRTQEAFSAISKAWLRSGWDTKYVYSFTWLGRPIIQSAHAVYVGTTQCLATSSHWFTIVRNCRKGDLSVTNQVGKEIVSLPFHSCMSTQSLDRIVDAPKFFI